MTKERTTTRAEPVASVGLHDRERGYVSAIHSGSSCWGSSAAAAMTTPEPIDRDEKEAW